MRTIGRWKWVSIAAVVIGSVFSPGTAKAQKSTIDYRKMERDLDIMENILEKLLSSVEMEPLHFQRDIQGFYLENYGVVFYAPRTSSLPFDFSEHIARLRLLQEAEKQHRQQEEAQKKLREAQRQYDAARKKYKEATKGLPSPSKKQEPEGEIKPGKEIESEEPVVEPFEPMEAITEPVEPVELEEIQAPPEPTTAKQALETLKSNLAEFLGNYADAIRQLQPGDWISVIADFNDGGTFAVPGEEPLRRLIAQASKREISEFRHTNGDLQAFQKRIRFTTQTVQEKLDKDIEILASIFETAMKQRSSEAFGGTSETNGLYLDPLGALFFMKVDLSSPLTVLRVPSAEVLSQSEKSAVRSRGRESGVVIGMLQGKQKREESWRERVNQLKDETVELLKDYGQTLRKLKADDWVVVAVDLGRSWDQSQPRTMLITAKKSDIDAANKERISLEEFKRRVQIREY